MTDKPVKYPIKYIKKTAPKAEPKITEPDPDFSKSGFVWRHQLDG